MASSTASTTHPYAILTFKHDPPRKPSINDESDIVGNTMDCDDLLMYSGFPTSTVPSCDTSVSGASSLGGASGSSLSLISSTESSVDCASSSSFHSPDDVDADIDTLNAVTATAVAAAAAGDTYVTPFVTSDGLDVSLDAECIFMTGSNDFHDGTGATIESLCDVFDETLANPSINSIDDQPITDDSVASSSSSSHVASAVQRTAHSPSLSTAVARPAPVPRAKQHGTNASTQTQRHRSDTNTVSTADASPSSSQTSDNDTQCLGQHSFNVGTRYRVCDVIGEGAYGVVCSAVHRATGQKVAIKKIQPFEHQMFALRTLRELKLLRHFQELDVCENIISILDVVKAPTFDRFSEVYFIQELMETDLHRVVRSQKLSDDHAQYFIYQILRALKVMHSADVIHRDLKPSNLLLNANCDLKVCDFGLARSVLTAEPGGETGYMTEYVATRWYRAPEIMLTFKQYTKAIDVWSVGCVLAEMISGRPLFPGRDYHHQISLILDVLGTPSIDDWYAIGSRRSRDYIRQMPLRKRKDFAKLFPTATPEALDFLHKTLAFNPKKRPTVEECLAHPYLAAYHDPEDEPSISSLPPSHFAYDLQPRPTTEQLRQQMWDEIETLPRYI